MAKVAVRQPVTGQAWSGDAIDPGAYVLKIANALGMWVEYSLPDNNGRYKEWTEVYPTKGLPPMDGK